MIRVETVLKDLRNLWANLGKSETTGGGVLRACAMTLIVADEYHADVEKQNAGEIIGELMHEHPSRAIVIRQQPGADLDARVFAQCWMPFGRRQQICCEQIEITAPPEGMGEVPNSVLALMAPDLPVVLWCRGAQWFASSGYEKLLTLADKAIFDSTLTAPARGLSRLRVLRSSGRRVGDLAWTRLTFWRETIAQAWGDGTLREVTGSGCKVTVTHPGKIRTSGACYMTAWLERTLPGHPVKLISQDDDPSPASTPEALAGVCSVRFEGASCRVELAAADGALELRTRSSTVRSPEPAQTEYALMREELGVLDGDRKFEAALPRAADLAARPN